MHGFSLPGIVLIHFEREVSVKKKKLIWKAKNVHHFFFCFRRAADLFLILPYVTSFFALHVSTKVSLQTL